MAVIGAGAMGSGIAQVAAAAGHLVTLYDARHQAAENAIESVKKALRRQVDNGKLAADNEAVVASRLAPGQALADCREAALVIEAIVEDLVAKRSLLSSIEDVVAEDAILATNTSSFSVTRLAAGLRRPDRLVGMHFFNPAPVMQLVEIISGLATSPEVASCAFETAAAWGKTPVHAKSSPGFIVNRVARPYYAEALRLLNEGAVDPATLDALMREAGGFRMGPFELMDLIGHDVNYAVTESVFQAFYGDRRFTPSLTQLELVNAGFLGRKSGRGFYDYGSAGNQPIPQSESPAPAPAQPQIFEGIGVFAPLTQRLAGAHNVLARPPEPRFGSDCLVALPGVDAALYVTDGRTATERAQIRGLPNTFLIDLALDFGSCKRVALSCSDQCSPEARQAVIGLLQHAQLVVTILDDVPGMAVMRTVAMLANEAADTVLHGVCSPEAVDLAMRKGVNYPRGPLTWADEIGIDWVCTVLQNLQRTYGEERFRTSVWLKRRSISADRAGIAG